MGINYKGNQVVVIDREDYLIIRLSNKYGFRWFKAPLAGKYLSIKKAVDIEKSIQDNPFKTKYSYMCPICL